MAMIRSRFSPVDFARLVREPCTETRRLQRGVELVVALVPGCDHAGVSVLTPAFVETVAASDDVVRRGDSGQHELSEGPGLDSLRLLTSVLSQDVRVDPRWRSWGPRVAADLGVASALSLVLGGRGGTVGCLTLYADRPGAWDDASQVLARTLAHQLALAGADARMLDDRERDLASRTGLGQAVGMVMERLGLGPDEAYEHLRRLSLLTQIDLGHLAAHVVATREIPRP